MADELLMFVCPLTSLLFSTIYPALCGDHGVLGFVIRVFTRDSCVCGIGPALR